MSDAVPALVVATLFVAGSATRLQRFYAHETVELIGEFRAGVRGPLIDVDEVSWAFLRPDGGDPIAPVDFGSRLSTGRYLCRVTPVLPGTYKGVLRCSGPTAAVDVKSFVIDPLPAGASPPPLVLITDDSGTFLLLSSDGALITP